MKVTFNWLKQYVDFDWSPGELSERLTMLGLEVEDVTSVAGEFDGIVVAQILSRDKVPGSDKLSVCKVNDGKGERTIICGAQNHKVGDKVALILPNYALPLKPGENETRSSASRSPNTLAGLPATLSMISKSRPTARTSTASSASRGKSAR